MFIQNLRAKIGARLDGNSEAGFTLIELLVVMLILGILAAIALPAFFNQKTKANDAKAKEEAHTVQVAMETCGTKNAGSYATCNEAALKTIEPTLNSGPAFTTTNLKANEYTITVTAETDRAHVRIARNGEGKLSYPCTPKSYRRLS